MYANPPYAPMALFFFLFFPFNSRFENKMRAGCTEISHVCNFQLWQIGTVDASSSDLFIYLRGRREEREGRGRCSWWKGKRKITDPSKKGFESQILLPGPYYPNPSSLVRGCLLPS